MRTGIKIILSGYFPFTNEEIIVTTERVVKKLNAIRLHSPEMFFSCSSGFEISGSEIFSGIILKGLEFWLDLNSIAGLRFLSGNHE